ncbi:ADP-ribose pyrophosphatase [Geomicrobium halophilum]|uniref:ADP-ribose pyrophosphatase n=1 Tax=Geomicrobium halophilum TaxID=549000 RepID=A0A841PML1_9BACL|nr:NUDIX hydrolase [Geomicrobium halophilum]MBB6448964.1 ADP-ribose pyrophosphatase [Geomicrobium halophilum]
MAVNHEPTLSKQTIYDGKIFNVELHEVELPDGNASKREVVKHPGAVAVVGMTDDGKIPLVRQFRKATEEFLLEIPAGKREAGEEAISTAVRELKEETGYTAGHLEEIAQLYTSPGFANELISIYIASDLQVGVPQTEADEFLTVEEWTLEEIRAGLNKQSFRDAKTAFAVQTLLARANS